MGEFEWNADGKAVVFLVTPSPNAEGDAGSRDRSGDHHRDGAGNNRRNHRYRNGSGDDRRDRPDTTEETLPLETLSANPTKPLATSTADPT